MIGRALKKVWPRYQNWNQADIGHVLGLYFETLFYGIVKIQV